MSRKFNEDMMEALEQNDYDVFEDVLQRAIGKVRFNNVVQYRDCQEAPWKFGITVYAEQVYNEEDWYINFLGSDGYVETYFLNFEEPELFDEHTSLFWNLDDNYKTLKKCKDLFEAVEFLKECEKDGNKVLEEV